MAQTMLLDQKLWDLVADASGNWAVASEPYSISQDVCSAIRTFLGECWFNTAIGVPYFQQILGQFPTAQFIKSQLVAAALTVPDVTSATCFLSSLVGRAMTGQVQFTFTLSTVPGQVATSGVGIINFIGDNQGVVTFVGDNGAFVQFVGS